MGDLDFYHLQRMTSGFCTAYNDEAREDCRRQAIEKVSLLITLRYRRPDAAAKDIATEGIDDLIAKSGLRKGMAARKLRDSISDPDLLKGIADYAVRLAKRTEKYEPQLRIPSSFLANSQVNEEFPDDDREILSFCELPRNIRENI